MTVTVATSESEAEVALDASELAELDRAIAEADADTSEPVPNVQVLVALDRLAQSRNGTVLRACRPRQPSPSAPPRPPPARLG